LLLNEKCVINLQIFSPMTDGNQENGLLTCSSKFKLILES
jgi:hypothetical protein